MSPSKLVDEPRAAAIADVGIEIEVAGRLMLADRVLARPQAGELVLAVGVGERRGDDVAVRVEQVDPHAGDRRFAVVRIAVGIGRDDDLAADRAGLELAEVVLGAHLAPVDHHRLIMSPGTGAALPPRLPGVSMPSSQPLGWTSTTEYLPASQIVELVEARGVGRRPQAGVVAVLVEQLHHDAGDAFFRRAIEDAVVRAVVIHVAREHHADLLAEVVLDGVHARHEHDAR